MASATDSDHPQALRFHHEAVFYAGEDDFLAATIPFLRDGAERGEPMLVAVSEPKIEATRAELGADADAVEFVDMEELGRNPARIIPVWHDFLESNGGEDSPVRGIGEPVWPGRSDAELVECVHHESLLNLAFADSPAWSLICPYDVAGLEDEVLEAALQTHPHVGEDGGHAPSPSYEGPATTPLREKLSAPATATRTLGFVGAADLALLRRFIVDCAQGANIGEARIADLVLAVNEAATNSVRHGGGHGRLAVWIEDGALICEVRDEGRIEDPLVGRVRPRPEQLEGRGLYVANQLCDLVQVRSGPEGTAVRLHMHCGS